MKTYVQPGNTITLTAPYAVASGDGLLVGSIFGVASGTATLGETVEAALVGVYELKKLGSQAWAVGDRIYWDNTARQTTKVTTSNTLIGVATEVAAGERAVSAAIREAGTGLKAAWRLQITGAGLGARLARTIRSEQFPKVTPSLNAAAVVWSNAPVIVGAHDTGPLIRSKNGFWLAIPTPAAGKSLRGGRITPGEWERRTGLRLRFIYRRRGPSLLVAEGRLNTKGRAVASRSKTGRGLVTAPIFLLVPQVKLPKRLDLARDAERAVDGVQGLIVANWVG